MIGKRFIDQRKKIDMNTFVDRTSVQVLRVSSVPAGVDVAPFSFHLAMERLRSSRVAVILSVTAPRPTSRWRDRLSKTLSDTPSNLFARTFVCRIWVFSICSELSNAFEMSFALRSESSLTINFNMKAHLDRHDGVGLTCCASMEGSRNATFFVA